ncbi:DUF4307 domain-containing protein [Angustibacter aerolatus]|nr:DUF4307 domain-containing protein [Angustibacter aerolatus]
MPTDLDARYGRVRSPGRRRRATVLGVAAGVVVALAFGVWAAVTQWSVDVHWQQIGYVVEGDAAVQVTYDVQRPRDRVLTCRLRALDEHKTAVGIASVTVPAGGPSEVRRTDVVRTSARAVTGLVDSCG